jgi:hypothetical protein
MTPYLGVTAEELRLEGIEEPVEHHGMRDDWPNRSLLSFKSFKTGTLITNNGLPTAAFIAPLPPPKPSPEPSQLSATTPAFVPRTPQVLVALPNNALPSPNTGTPASQCVQDLIQDLRSPVNAGVSHQAGQYYNLFRSTPPPGSSQLTATPGYQLGPVRPPRVYFQRTDKSKRDIIITADGVIRNAVKVIERFLPNGTPYHEYLPEFDGPEYDFVADFNAKSIKEKMDLLANKQIEILVKFDTYDEEEKVEFVFAVKKKNKGKKKKKGAATNEESSKDVDVMGKGKEKGVVEAATLEPEFPTVIDTIAALGSGFAENIKSLYVTLDFTSIPVAAEANPAIPTGPRAAAMLLPPSGPLVFGQNFTLITNLVRALQSFTEIKHMVVNLRVLSAHNIRPITIPQLTLILPFYDLGFTDWKVSYQTEFFTTSVPVRDHDYPLKWLDRERNKILREREKKIENVVFVRRSSVDGKVATWAKQKK